MTDKLLNINEVAEYLGLDREQVKELVENGVIPAYKIAGSFLRFNKKEVDGIKDKIYDSVRSKPKLKEEAATVQASSYSFGEKVSDFFYFNNFYLVSLIVIAAIIFIIFS